MNEIEDFYKLQLSQDLIVFLMHVQLDGLPLETKKKRTAMIMNSWSKRVESKIKKIASKAMVSVNETIQDPNTTLDVLEILTNINQIEPSLIREEFKDNIINNILKTFK